MKVFVEVVCGGGAAREGVGVSVVEVTSLVIEESVDSKVVDSKTKRFRDEVEVSKSLGF